ncbi:MAG: DUF4292 domain-containing protein [Tannerellaceae bacterium]|nr:DUF4292 domain-containing protein [Tannerellaceae bacterium]
MRRYFFHIVISSLLLAVLWLAGCKSTKTIGTVTAEGTKEQGVFFDSMMKQALQYENLSARMNVELQLPGKEFSSRVDLKILKDRVLQLSVQPFLGIEVFRMEITPDSIKVVDRMNKRYVAENYIQLKGQAPVDFNFYNLQALFTNRIFIPGEQGFTPKQYSRFKLNQGGSVVEAKIKDSSRIAYTFKADGEEKLLSTDITDETNRYALQWLYTDFQLTQDQVFPMFMDVRVLVNGQAEGGMKINFSRIQTDTSLNFDFSIPDKYKRITFAEILKGLSSTK